VWTPDGGHRRLLCTSGGALDAARRTFGAGGGRTKTAGSSVDLGGSGEALKSGLATRRSFFLPERGTQKYSRRWTPPSTAARAGRAALLSAQAAEQGAFWDAVSKRRAAVEAKARALEEEIARQQQAASEARAAKRRVMEGSARGLRALPSV
jgi:hypothetical protein